MSEEEEETKRKLILFGRDVSEIPCFRNSYLYGISSGIGMGLTYFMFTSKVRMATHVGFGSFLGITMIYWIHCRYKYSLNKFNMGQLQAAMKKKAMYEGTERAERIEKNLKDA
uniref:Cytochrome c oxidase assembly protein COX20, mitochondrial n=1 Tax=Timema poppense TaxID=170557 RepID=A0A7R9CWL5_TIMPO|nr:unnamed protein product [Timema poppensis]